MEAHVIIGPLYSTLTSVTAVVFAVSVFEKTPIAVMLYEPRASLLRISIEAEKSRPVVSATDLSTNESTTIPFLNRGKFCESRIDKSCLPIVAISSNDSEV